ncbi:MAG: two-component regulator propeller domain-containing protein [Sphingobacteriaceae bacterium]
MIIRSKILFLCFIFLSASFGLFSQTYPFKNLTIENGLSQKQVLSVFQDDKGIIWLGTNGGGVTRYDGVSFENYTDVDGLGDNVVFCMAKDNDGKILIGTNNGLTVFDPKINPNNKAKRFVNYTTLNGLNHNRILFIKMNDKGVALLGTGSGLAQFDHGKCSRITVNSEIDSLPIMNYSIDSKQNKWYSTFGGGLYKDENGKFTNYTVKDGLNSNVIFNVLERKNDAYWLLTGEGLFELKENKLTQIYPAGLGKSSTCQYYLKDEYEQLWIATSDGLLKENVNGSFELIKTKNGLVDNNIWSIFQDKEKNLWFASIENGVSKLSSERFLIYDSKDGLLGNDIKEVYQDPNGDYWVGTKDGVSVLSKNGVKNFSSKPEELKGNSDVWSINRDTKGNILIGTTNGLIVFNGSSFKRYYCKDRESPMNAIFDVFVDKNGEIWLGTQAGVATIVDGNIEAFEKVSITKNFINKIYQDLSGAIWFGTEEGLYVYTGNAIKQFTEKDGFTRKRISTITKDNNNAIWVATGDGLYKYNNGTFTKFKEKAYTAVDEILSMVVDKSGSLWVGLSNGIDKIDFQNGKTSVRHYGSEDGFIGQTSNPNAIIVDQEGRVAVGTTYGLIFYRAAYDKENRLAPTMLLKSVDLFYQKTDWRTYTDTVDISNLPVNLELPYDKNYLTFNFIGVSISAPEKVNYKYMLKGLDNDWRLTNKPEVTYSNIPPGKYEFMIYSNNGEGVWNKEPVTFSFVINPPFWRTWWFYSIIALIVLSGIYSYIKIRTANFKILKQNEIIEEKNEALLYANQEIAEKNQNITDSINYAKRLQQSFLTSEKVLNQILNDHFILFKPRDIVSGDFYLAFDMPDRTLIICADCTGHGIPGAFMSLIGISLLNEIKRSQMILGTSEILERLRNNIIAALNPDKNETGGKDGMDVSLIAIFKEPVNNGIKIQFSGANNSMYLVTGSSANAEMIEYKGDKQPVGYYSNMKPFTQHEVVAQKGDIIYLYTDGYADQFGGMNGKKFMSKQLKGQLMSIFSYPMSQQKEKLDEIFKSWQGRLEQVDDVTVIGIKLN